MYFHCSHNKILFHPRNSVSEKKEILFKYVMILICLHPFSLQGELLDLLPFIWHSHVYLHCTVSKGFRQIFYRQ